MRRGSAAALVMVVIAAMLVAAAVFSARMSEDLVARRSDDVRLQALWLARSALETGVTGTVEVDTPAGHAVVEVSGGACVVRLDGAEARVTREPYGERFSAGN